MGPIFTFIGVGGSWILEDSYNSNNQMIVTSGTLNTNNQTVASETLTVNSGGTSPTYTLGSSVITLSGTNNAINLNGSPTINAGTSSITCTGANSGLANNGGGTLTWYSVAFHGTGTTTIAGTNVFTNLTRSNAAACAITFPSSKTQTINGTLQLSGTSGAVVTITASTGGTAATLSCPNQVSCDWLSLKDNTAAGDTPFYAGLDSSIVSNVTNWDLTGPPVGGDLDVAVCN